jgi:hypothetical protein
LKECFSFIPRASPHSPLELPFKSSLLGFE